AARQPEGLLAHPVPGDGDQDAMDRRLAHGRGQTSAPRVSRRHTTQEPKATITKAIATSIPPLTGPSGFRIRKYAKIQTPRASERTPMKVNGNRTATQSYPLRFPGPCPRAHPARPRSGAPANPPGGPAAH